MSKRRCGTCRFYQEAGLAGSGWCHHPQRKTTSDLLIMVRRNELACRDQWARDLWQDAGRLADGQTPAVGGGPPSGPVQPATPQEIAAVVQAEAGAGSTAPTARSVAGSVPALEDVVLSETGVGRRREGASQGEPSQPSWSWRGEEEGPAAGEIDTRAAIKKAREAYRDRNRKVVRGDFDGPEDGAVAPASHGGERSAIVEAGGRAEAVVPERGELGGDGEGQPALLYGDGRGHQDATSAEAEGVAGGAAVAGAPRRDPESVAGVSGHGAEDAGKSSDASEEETRWSASPLDGRRTGGGRKPQRLDSTPGVRVVPDRAALVAEKPLLTVSRSAGEPTRQGEPLGWRSDRRERAQRAMVVLGGDEGDEESDDGGFAAEGASTADGPVTMELRDREEDVSAGGDRSDWDMDASGPIAVVEDDSDLQPAGEPVLVLGDRVVELGDGAGTSTWGEGLPRVCRTCRDFRPAEGGGRGWCANQWAFSHRRVVAAEDETPCESSFGSWWLPVDEVWSDGVDVAAHGQPTPLLDAFLPHHRDEPRRERRRS